MGWRETLAFNPIAAVMSDPRRPDNPIVECNHAFETLTGYDREEIIGRNCRFLAGPDTEPWLTQAIRSGISKQQPVLVELLNYKKDGTAFRNAVMVAPLFDEHGELEYFLGSQIEISSAGKGSDEARELRRQAYHKILGLSDRQREVLVLLAAGLLHKQIAHEVGITERTVKMHRAALLKALDVRTTAEAIRIAVEAGF